MRSTRAVLSFLIVVFVAVTPIAAETIVVNPQSTAWEFEALTCGSSNTATFELTLEGPLRPPVGRGSLAIETGTDGNSYVILRNTQFPGVRLDSITDLTYSTFVEQTDVSPSRPRQAPLLVLRLDTDNDGSSDVRIYFEPPYQEAQYTHVPDQGEIVLGAWQEWDALIGGWWSSPTSCSASAGSGTKTITDILTCFPDATIVNADDGAGGVYMFAGCGSSAWPNWIGALDNLTISAGGDTTIFDFEGEPNPIPALSELGLFAFVLMLVAVAIAAMKIRL